MFHLMFLDYTRLTLVQPLVFGFSAVFFIVFDTATLLLGQQEFSTRELVFSFVLIIMFAAGGWFQSCEYVFVGCYSIFNLLNLINGFEAASFAICILMIFWLMRSWIVPTILVLALEGITATAVSLTPCLQALSSILNALIVLTVGLVLRWQNGRRVLAEQEKERAWRSMVENRRELARQLHDTTAKDLAHVAVLAQDLASRSPKLAVELNPIIEVAIQASQRIRSMILSIDTSASEVSLSQIVVQVRQMLLTRNITLDAVLPENLDHLLTRQQKLTGGLSIRECAANILKYAPASSEANLLIEIQVNPRILTISFSNEIASSPIAPEMSSGYGLVSLQGVVRAEGGTMEVSKVGGQWLTYITIPAGNLDGKGSNDG